MPYVPVYVNSIIFIIAYTKCKLTNREEFVPASEELRSAEIDGTDLPGPGRTNRSDSDQTASKSSDETDQYFRDSGHVSDHIGPIWVLSFSSFPRPFLMYGFID